MAAKKSSKKKAGAKKKAAAKKRAAPKKKAAPKEKAAPKKQAAAKKAAAKKAAIKPAATKPAEEQTAEEQTAAAKPAKKAAAKAAKAATTAGGAEAPAENAAAEPAEKPAEKPAAAKPKAPPEPEEEVEPEPELPKMPKMPARKKGVITLAYGNTADQAFMIFGLANQKVDTEDREYKFKRDDLESLTSPATRGVHDVTSLSFGAYPQIQSRYLLLPCGAAFGDHRGPLLVSRTPIRANEVQGLAVAVPSEDHTAAIALRLWLPRAKLQLTPMPTAHIGLMIRANKIRSGLLVNEDQITYRDHHLVRVVDLGHWWGEETEGLPLAMSAMVIRRDIAEGERAKIALDLKRSIAYALGHREEALEWAMQFAGNRDQETLDGHVLRYVNDLSLDSGERGRQAVDLLFERAHTHGLMPERVHTFYSG